MPCISCVSLCGVDLERRRLKKRKQQQQQTAYSNIKKVFLDYKVTITTFIFHMIHLVYPPNFA